MPFQEFAELRVFQLAETFCDHVWDVVLKWQTLAINTVGIQLVRAADSIGANIAEGHGSGSAKENRRFVRISKKSLNETRYWLRRAQARKLLPADQAKRLRNILDNLRPALIGYLASLDRRLRK